MSLWPEIRAAKDGVFYRPAGTLFTVNGTGSPDPFGFGFPGDMARRLNELVEGMWTWMPTGYPAAVFPMLDSINAAISRPDGGGLRDRIAQHPIGVPKVLSGYSQGAVVVDKVWREDILPDDGILHAYKDDIVAIINWGDPMRTPGISNGNLLEGRQPPGKTSGQITGGIAGPDCLRPEETPSFLLSFNNPGDLYGSAPVGLTPWDEETEVGHNETLIYNAVMKFDGTDLLAFAQEIFEILTMPWSQLWPLVQAIWNGLSFVANPNPHNVYSIDAAVNHMITLGNDLRAAA